MAVLPVSMILFIVAEKPYFQNRTYNEYPVGGLFSV